MKRYIILKDENAFAEGCCGMNQEEILSLTHAVSKYMMGLKIIVLEVDLESMETRIVSIEELKSLLKLLLRDGLESKVIKKINNS